jgi:hypothetical protein
MAITPYAQPKVRREVGFSKVKGKILTYSRVPKDDGGWANAAKFSPLKGDLMLLKMQDREVIGWWGGAYWFGYKVKEKDRVSKWKPANYEYD